MVRGNKVKALSIRQPWAELIVRGDKKIEIRSWNTNFRGYFLMHTSKKIEEDAAKNFGLHAKELDIGAIVGYANLADVVVYKGSEEFLKDNKLHLSLKEREKYPVYGFVLDNVRRIKPVKYKGQLGFFNVPEIDYAELDKLV